MAKIYRFNNAEFSAMSDNLLGVTLIYRSIRKDGTLSESCINLTGDDFVPMDNSEEESFRVWKNTIKLHWDAKRTESPLRQDNGGISIKLRSSTPAEIRVCNSKCELVYFWKQSDSIFSRIGIMPTKKDLEELIRDYKKKMHKAAKASFDAIRLKFEFEAPEMEAPVMEAPAMEAPAMEAPAMEAPAMEAPAMEAPAMEAPAMEAPAMEAPAKKKLSDEEKAAKRKEAARKAAATRARNKANRQAA